MTPKVLRRLNVLAICLLGGVLASVLVAQVVPRARPIAGQRVPREEDEWPWPQTLRVYPSHPGDPVKLIGITKDGKEVEPGTYRIPVMADDTFGGPNPFDRWLQDVSFVVTSETPRKIVCIGISVVLPAHRTNIVCFYLGEPAPNPWCDAHPHWCDGGCPILVHRTIHWGRIPPRAATGLESRFRAEGRWGSPVLDANTPLQSRPWLVLGPGQVATLSMSVGVDGMIGSMDPRTDFSNVINTVLRTEGIEEATGEEPCTARANSKTGCAFAEVSKFNIGVDVVYFEDGTIWGNYGYGYALPNPDGIFRRVDAQDFPGIVSPASAPN
jgi:hypothetical protein